MWTKQYSFTNNTKTDQNKVTIMLYGIKNIIKSSITPINWQPLSVSIINKSMVYYTTLTWQGSAKIPGTAFNIAWQTSDNNCKVMDFRWGDGEVVTGQGLI